MLETEAACDAVRGLNALIFCGDVNCAWDLRAAQHSVNELGPAGPTASRSDATSLPLQRERGGVVDTKRAPELPTYSNTFELLLGLCKRIGGIV